jgi:hypothetical protein
LLSGALEPGARTPGGAFLANALPQFVNGISGSAFQSPFALPPGEGLSSSTINVLWGLLNLAVAYLLVCCARQSLGLALRSTSEKPISEFRTLDIRERDLMRGKRFIGFALGIAAIVGGAASSFLRPPFNSSDIVGAAVFCAIAIPFFVVVLNRSYKEMDENEKRIADSGLRDASSSAPGVLKIGTRQLTFNQRRAVIGVALIPAFVCATDYFLRLGLFGSFGKIAFTISILVLVLTIKVIAPTVADVREYRAWKRAR